MFKFSKDTVVKIVICCEIMSFISFLIIGLFAKTTEWKLFSFGLMLCSLISIMFRFVIIRRFIKNGSTSPDFETKKEELLFKEKLLGIIPVGIIFLISAIYSIFNRGEFLPIRTSIIFLVILPLMFFSLFRSRNKVDN